MSATPNSHNCSSPETNLVLTSTIKNNRNSGGIGITSNGVNETTKHSLSSFNNQQPQVDFSLSPKTTDLIAMDCNNGTANAQTVMAPIVNKQQTPTKYAQNSPFYSDNIPITGMQVSGAGGGSLNNTQISMMIQSATGFFSRSNSQPDLTQLNCMEKPVTNSSNGYGINSNDNNSYCCYFNANLANSNGSAYNNG